MKNTILRTGLALGLIALFSSASIASVSAQFITPYSSPIFTTVYRNTDMLIFVSPQYAYDIEIRTAIESYISAVKEDIGWNTRMVSLTQKNNEYQTIDQTIERYYRLYKIKACIMVGEDTDTAFGGDSDYMEKPSIVPWYTIGGVDAYEVSEQGIVSRPYEMDICISLMYPTNDLDYQTKKSHIIAAFYKFSNQRHVGFDGDILVFESSDINTNSEEMYKGLDEYGNLIYTEDASSMSLDGSYSMYYVHGHSIPAGTDVNADDGGWFSADNVDELDTPFFGADGCYVGGWWSDKSDNNVLDSSIDCSWYGSKIFTSKSVQVMVLGLLSQNGFYYPVSFIENAVPDLLDGATLAESMIGHTYVGDNVLVYGDPTFHYTF